jgi:hypothetical protein
MPTLDDVYRKFGEAAEAAQLLETELGNMLLLVRYEGLPAKPRIERIRDILDTVNRHTLGQLLKALNNHEQSPDALNALLTKARDERNRLSHSFYREHNLRRNSEEGRALMVQDLEAIHAALLDAYKAIMLLQGIDLYTVVTPLPAGHLPL